MVIEKLRAKESVSDEEFDSIFPEEVRGNSNRHYTSVYISQLAANFLSNGNKVKVLDIGSGTGKFCMVGAICTQASFTGVEFRKYQSDIAKGCAEKHKIQNVNFIHSDILDVSFEDFEAFYIFNPFLENLDFTARMDNLIDTKENSYELLLEYVHNQLDSKCIGTRLVTYWTSNKQVPKSYKLIKSIMGDKLRFWEKEK